MDKFYKKKPPHTHGLLYIVIFLLLLCSLCAVSISFYRNHRKWKSKKLSNNESIITLSYLKQIGDIREFPTAVGVARELQKAETIFLKEIVKVFEKHGIRYWLDGGTLLGSIRHGGFIPWDDDIDIGVMREDYDKLQEIFGEAFSSDSNFYFIQGLFGKVKYKGTKLFIDIFPFDVYPKYIHDTKDREVLREKIKDYSNSFKLIHSPEIDWKIIGNKSPQEVIHMRNKLLEANPSEKKLLLLCPESARRWPYIFDYDWVFPLKTATFEVLSFKIPNCPEVYLFEEYEDWMQYPKEIHDHKITKKMRSVEYANMLKFIEKYGE